ncbi:MAG: septation protein SepH [Actinomycetota bacterium]|nr:septation protein SepH [Actinomycetota bacterium]
MQDLRLVGVHDDGEHLLLSGAGGDIFRLRIDEALRVAASRTPARPAAVRPAAEAPRLSPRDIQMQIRSGATAEEVAESSGLPLAHIQRYEGPVLAEREYIARQARNMEISAAVASHDGYRTAFGDNAASLDEMVTHRLGAFGISPSSVVWDAWRRPDGTWTVSADFDAAVAGSAASIGESAPAQWTYNPGRKTIRNANRWALQLSELEPLDGPVPTRRLSAVADRPFDFETDAPPGGSGDAESPGSVDSDSPDPAGTEHGDEADSLLDMLRARRGQRLGIDDDDDDALATLLTAGVPAAHPRGGADAHGTGGPDGEDGAESNARPAADDDGTAAGSKAAPGTSREDIQRASRQADQRANRSLMFPALSLAPRHDHAGRGTADGISLHEVSTQTREIRIPASPKTAPAAETPRAGSGSGYTEDDEQSAGRQDRKAPVKPKRSSVPSWDEIVFGTKGD